MSARLGLHRLYLCLALSVLLFCGLLAVSTPIADALEMATDAAVAGLLAFGALPVAMQAAFVVAVVLAIGTLGMMRRRA